MRGNSPAAERRTGTQTGGHDTITVAQHSHDERAGQDAEGSGEADSHELRRMASKMTEVKKEQIKDLKRLYDG